MMNLKTPSTLHYKTLRYARPSCLYLASGAFWRFKLPIDVGHVEQSFLYADSRRCRRSLHYANGPRRANHDAPVRALDACESTRMVFSSMMRTSVGSSNLAF